MSPSDKSFDKQEEELIQFKEKHHYELRDFSLGFIQNEVLTITSRHQYSEDYFDIKFQVKIYPSNKIKKKQEEELI